MPKPQKFLVAIGCGFLLLILAFIFLPVISHADPEVTEMRAKGEISAEPHFEYKRIKRDIGGIKNGSAVNGTAREIEIEGELEIKYGILDSLMLVIEFEYVFKEKETATLRFADEIEKEKEEEKGLGDITFELVYRILKENKSQPIWVLGLGLKPQTARARDAVEEEIETGNLKLKDARGARGRAIPIATSAPQSSRR